MSNFYDIYLSSNILQVFGESKNKQTNKENHFLLPTAECQKLLEIPFNEVVWGLSSTYFHKHVQVDLCAHHQVMPKYYFNFHFVPPGTATDRNKKHSQSCLSKEVSELKKKKRALVYLSAASDMVDIQYIGSLTTFMIISVTQYAI